MKKDIKELIKLAIENKKNSYSPYSNFRVSSVVLTKKGNIYKGVNIENAAYSVTLCAERSALSSAISAGDREIDTIVITGDSTIDLSLRSLQAIYGRIFGFRFKNCNSKFDKQLQDIWTWWYSSI